MSWPQYYRNIAEVVKTKSKDASTKVGAVLVAKDNTVISIGYNSFPRGIVDDKPERQERPEKYFWFMHAEQNAIVNAARVGTATLGSKMYLTCSIPCSDCTKALINAGVVEIYCSEPDPDMESRWGEHTKRSVQMLQEAGVKVNFYDW